uniref:Uncharacterized protein n=1 Tax=Trichobilharzia regenti TaxID=157069 RepID=A0AA85JP80_TRIRE|nr:unnamed protein product [Trichobilharzia regenti]
MTVTESKRQRNMHKNIHIAVITLLAFVAINEGNSLKIKKINQLLKSTESKIPWFSNQVKSNMKKVQTLVDKFERKKKKIGKYVTCIRDEYKYKHRKEFDQIVFKTLKSVYKNEKSLYDCVKAEANEYKNKGVNFTAEECKKYLVGVNDSDKEYLYRAKFAASIYLEGIHKIAIKNLKQVKKSTLKNRVDVFIAPAIKP